MHNTLSNRSVRRRASVRARLATAPLAIAPLAVALSSGWLLAQATPPAAPAAPPAARIVRLDPALDKIVSVTAPIEKVATGFGFVEGPVWTRDGALLFSDIPGNAIMRMTRDGTASVFRKPSGYTGTEPRNPGSHIGSNGLAFDREGRLLIAEHGDRRLTRIETNGQATVLADRYEGKRLNSPNDIVVRRDGSIYFTDPPYGLPQQAKDPGREIPFSGIYRLANGTLQLLAQELPFPNGMGFSPDERFLYIANSDQAKRFWMKYEVKADGTLGSGTVFYDASADTAKGIPDGLKVDTVGNLVATGPGGVFIISPAGTLLGRIELPEQPANVAWGDDGRTLYMTARTSVYRVQFLVGGPRPN